MTRCRNNGTMGHGGDFMPDGTKITVKLEPSIMEKLERICEAKGIRRPAAISIAIEKLWKEEYADK